MPYGTMGLDLIRVRAMANLVEAVLGMRSPVQVFRSAIGFYAVPVSGLLPFLRRTVKRHADQTMNVPVLVDAAHADHHGGVLVDSLNSQNERFSALQTSDAPQAAGFVMAFQAGDCAPFLHAYHYTGIGVY